MKVADFFKKFEGESLTYDDLTFFPQFIDFPLEEVSLSTHLTREIKLNIPIVSSPMDTVTEADLAIGLALQGGIGFIHNNMSPEEQRKQVEKVKRFKNGFISDPITLAPHSTIRQVVAIRREHGYSTIPITEDGSPEGQLVGMITKYDYSTFSDEMLSKRVRERMIPVTQLNTATVDELTRGGLFDPLLANRRLLEGHSVALPVVDTKGNLRYLVTRSDLDKHQNYPDAALDENQKLRVGVAVETWQNKAIERIEALESVVDVVVLDTAQGFTRYELDLIRWIKEFYPHLQVIGGNVVSAEACRALIGAGADAVRVGMGSASICTSNEVGGVGRGQASAIYECAQACREANVPVIADGGVGMSSHILKALGLGATTVMLGSLLGGTTEAPGRSHIRDGIRYKEYRGMGSISAMEKGSATRYATQNSSIRIPEGVAGMVPSRGSLSEWLPCLMQGVKQGFYQLGYKDMKSLHKALIQNGLEVERRSEEMRRDRKGENLFEVGMDSTPSIPKRPTAMSAAIHKIVKDKIGA